jgi:predicted AAA+ superfamily ATPase
MASQPYVERLLDRKVAELFGQHPALLVVGPRAAGKTTTAGRHAADVVRLDRPAEAAAFLADPDAALRTHNEPLLLDEWQAVPAVLGAVKRAVDQDSRAGRFLLTGSVRADLDAATWPGTGRLVRLRLYGLTVREERALATARETFLDRLARADIALFKVPAPVPDLVGYLGLALKSGFPEPLLRLGDTARRVWLESYLDQLLTRDVQELAGRRDPERLRRYFEALALNSAGFPEDRTLYTAAGIDHRTANQYERLLQNLFVLDVVPSWTTNRLKRLTKAPKRYLVDPALISAAVRVDTAGIMRDGRLLGRVLDTFVLAQIRPELEVAVTRSRLFHIREKNGRREVDIAAETASGILGIEVKATAAPDLGDAAHLVSLRDELGKAFLAGAVLHTGPGLFELSDRIFALPVAALWG